MVLRAILAGLLLLSLASLGVTGWIALRPAAVPPELVAEAPPPPPPAPARVTVLAAARPLRAGALLAPADIAPLEVEADALPEGSQRNEAAIRAELVGAMIRRSLSAGEPLRAGDLLRPGDRGFLAAILAPGMRAISIGTDAVSGAAGLIWPGDRVDLVLTQALDDQALPASRKVAGETVLADLRVIAIDQLLVQGATGLEPGAERTARTVTLEVTPLQAERVAVSARLGRLSLAVRSAEATPASASPMPATPTVTWAGDVSPALRGGAKRDGAPPRPLRVYQGTAKTEEFRF